MSKIETEKQTVLFPTPLLLFFPENTQVVNLECALSNFWTFEGGERGVSYCSMGRITGFCKIICWSVLQTEGPAFCLNLISLWRLEA